MRALRLGFVDRHLSVEDVWHDFDLQSEAVGGITIITP